MEHTLDNAIELVRLTPENSNFSVTENGFLMIDTQITSKATKEPRRHHGAPHGDDTKNPSEEKGPLTGKRRAFLHRAFPFDKPYEYISVSDDNGEIGIIFNTRDFAETASLLDNELDSKYFAPKIEKVLSLKERFGYSYWKVKCDRGNYDFTVKDTFKSIIHVSQDRVFILDVDSNRFEIESLEALDKKSFRKIELYL
ncbi:MAG: DUF1854 domain-containing protein [Ruminococcaceae bacterium]|nr:DUF1854 domain-containing protein [Oscillospiraceae bacterium]